MVEYAREATILLNDLKGKSKSHCLSGISNYLLEIKAITTRVKMVDSVSMGFQWIRLGSDTCIREIAIVGC